MGDKMIELCNEITNITETIRMPRKIKESLEQCIGFLKEEGKKDTEKLNNVMLVLEDINGIRTIPPMLRTEIWNLIGKVELSGTSN